MASPDLIQRIMGTVDQRYRQGWADGEQWVLDHWWDYTLRRYRLGRVLLRLRSRIRGRRLPSPTETVKR